MDLYNSELKHPEMANQAPVSARKNSGGTPDPGMTGGSQTNDVRDDLGAVADSRDGDGHINNPIGEPVITISQTCETGHKQGAAHQSQKRDVFKTETPDNLSSTVGGDTDRAHCPGSIKDPLPEPSYPIFFPTYTPIPTGYARDWWWYDPDIEAEDQGPFQTRSEAVADWAMEHYASGLIAEHATVDQALGMPILNAPNPPDGPRSTPGKALLVSLLKDAEHIAALDRALQAVVDLDEFARVETEYHFVFTEVAQ